MAATPTQPGAHENVVALALERLLPAPYVRGADEVRERILHSLCGRQSGGAAFALTQNRMLLNGHRDRIACVAGAQRHLVECEAFRFRILDRIHV